MSELTIALMFGSHLSVAGGMVNALHEAKRLKLDCVQVFTANQRQWKPKAPTLDEVSEWLDTLTKLNWDTFDTRDSARVVSHNSYLINLASPDVDSWNKSVAAMRAELERCEALHIPYCVSHPGAHLSGKRSRTDENKLDGIPTKDELVGLKRISKAVNRLHRDLSGNRTIICLETTVGSGTNLGYDFHHLAFIRDHVREPERVGFCFDTCHVTAAGYDMTTNARAQKVFEEWDTVCGLGHLRVFHLNDSEGGVGSRRDRHAHIGDGSCGRSCFRAIVNDRAFRAVPKVLETPKGLNDKEKEWDRVNIQRLKRMMRSPQQSR